MDRARISAILEAYGGDPAHWPEAERAEALCLIADEPDLAREQKMAVVLDSVLARAPAGEVSHALLTRILETSPRPTTNRMVSRPNTRPLRAGGLIHLPSFGGALAIRPLAILMLAVGIGLGAGALAPVMFDNSPSEVDMLSLMWGEPAFNQIGDAS